jgi:hypothetical protein
LVLTLTGLPAIVAFVGYVVVFSAPVWVAARLVGAEHSALLRAIGALAVGAGGVFFIAVFAGTWVFLLAPLVFLFSFQYILGTSVLGSVLLAILAGLAYAAMGYFFGGGSFSGGGNGINI